MTTQDTKTTSAPALLSRAQLALRWSCSIETLKRREKSGALKRILIGPRIIRYALADVLKIEGHKQGRCE